jgi:NADPH2:quinone reductase
MAAIIRFYRHGDPSVLTEEDEQLGELGPGQVQLRHEAIGVNFVDTAFRDGTFKVPLPAAAERGDRAGTLLSPAGSLEV